MNCLYLWRLNVHTRQQNKKLLFLFLLQSSITYTVYCITEIFSISYVSTHFSSLVSHIWYMNTHTDPTGGQRRWKGQMLMEKNIWNISDAEMLSMLHLIMIELKKKYSEVPRCNLPSPPAAQLPFILMGYVIIKWKKGNNSTWENWPWISNKNAVIVVTEITENTAIKGRTRLVDML